ncbi:MAG TPA: hypothetical protein DDW50_15320 [Firmicutes bacterium]|jgi:hypothetical protein|nr:hypothetical protein [Bacillota bacterium]
MSKLEQKNGCSQCLRNMNGVCMALKKMQWPCWAYMDNTGEFIKHEKERKYFIETHGGIA